MTVDGGNSHTQYSLHCHSVATVAPILEEAAGAVPLTIIVVGGMDIILTSKRCLEASELDSLGFFCIAFGFCDLIDHA